MKREKQQTSVAGWLDEYALPDERMGEAYESLESRERAVLKLCIARLHRIWGESPLRSKETVRYSTDFCLEREDRSVAYALFVCESGYAHPAALLAALMPAVLAGVTDVLPCFTHGGAGAGGRLPSAPLLAALELAGVERAFGASLPALEALLAMLEGERGPGRLVVLGAPPFGRELALMAHERGIICRFLTGVPRYYSDRTGMVALQSFGRPADPGGSGRIQNEMSESDLARVFLHLDAGHEEVWVWPDLSPSWFRARQMRLFSG